jgi:hypothetical protein
LASRPPPADPLSASLAPDGGTASWGGRSRRGQGPLPVPDRDRALAEPKGAGGDPARFVKRAGPPKRRGRRAPRRALRAAPAPQRRGRRAHRLGLRAAPAPLDHRQARLCPGPQGRDLGDRGRHYSTGRRSEIKFDLPPRAGRLQARRARSGSRFGIAVLIDHSATGMTRGARETSRRRGRPRPGPVHGNRRAHREAHPARPFGRFPGE